MEEDSFLFRFQRFFIELNLFKTTRIDERSLRIQIWSTRLYITVLFLSMSILLVYTTLEIQTEQIQIPNPSLSRYIYLYNKYDNVKCPCTEISIDYKTFLQMSALFHEVCSSDLVSDQWIDFLFDKERTSLRYPVDFRTTAFNQFQLLQELCRLSRTAIDDGIDTLYNNQLISGQLLYEQLFNAQVEADILAFKTITISAFVRSLSFMRAFTAGNELLPGIESAYTLVLDFDNQGQIQSPALYTNYYTDSNGTTCGCDDDFSCHLSAGFYDFDTYFSEGDFNQTTIYPREFVNGWKSACWPVESLLVSTLESFYNQTTLNRIVTNVNSSVSPNRFTALNVSQSSSFSSDTILNVLVENLFVEKWLQTLNYSSYYSQCQPRFCQYNINHRSESLYIITSLLGLYGGLSAVLHLIIPYVVKFLLKRIERRSTLVMRQTSNVNMRWSLQESIRNLWNNLLHLNLYRSPLRIEAIDIKHQIWSTRLYIGLISLSLFILTLYSSVSIGTRIIQINNPSLEIVQQLENDQYSLTCPCQVLSINYEDLFQLKARYHQICSSEFVREEWIEYLNEITSNANHSFLNTDFRPTSSSTFHILYSMCSLSQTTVTNALFQFGKSQLVTNELLQYDLFLNQINSTIEQFTQTLPNNLLRLLSLIRNITHLNQLISGGYSNFNVKYYIDEQSRETRATLEIDGLRPLTSDNKQKKCLCANNITCQTDLALYTYDDNGESESIDYIVPNFYTRCYPIESLLPSTMECFYDNNPCFDIINNISDQKIYKNFTRLDSSQASHFSVNSTINDLLEQLFVDSWSRTFNYSAYFDKCHPIYCSYTINQRRTPLEIVTTIAALIGGLSTIFRFLSLYMVSIFSYLIHRCRHRHQTTNTTVHQNANGNVWARITALFKKVRDTLFNLNLFENVDEPSLNENEISIERQSTRLYVLLLSLTVFILIVYTSLIYHSHELTVPISSLDSFIKFQNLHHSMVVNCPCTKLSIVRSTFYQIEPIFHQVCSSDFVTNQWLSSLFKNYQNLKTLPINAFTFPGTAFAHFQSMSIMCDLAKQAVIDARELFLQTSVVSSQMPNMNLFHLNTNSTLNDFQSSLSKNFIHNLEMFRALTQGSAFVSVYTTNWDLFLLPDLTEDQTIYMKSQSYGECDCATSASCIQNSIPNVPGYVVGCLPLESFLRSTIECLYDQICVNQISSYVNQSLDIPKSLQITKSRFAINTLINNITEEMFIESWISNVSYENFFEECQPSSCSYTITEQYNIIYVITTLLGLYGGITILLKLIVPRFMRQVYKYIHRRNQRNRQVMPFE